jgi:hypothetical protein
MSFIYSQSFDYGEDKDSGLFHLLRAHEDEITLPLPEDLYERAFDENVTNELEFYEVHGFLQEWDIAVRLEGLLLRLSQEADIIAGNGCPKQLPQDQDSCTVKTAITLLAEAIEVEFGRPGVDATCIDGSRTAYLSAFEAVDKAGSRERLQKQLNPAEEDAILVANIEKMLSCSGKRQFAFGSSNWPQLRELAREPLSIPIGGRFRSEIHAQEINHLIQKPALGLVGDVAKFYYSRPAPTEAPNCEPTVDPSSASTPSPSIEPSLYPTASPISEPSLAPSAPPTARPSCDPSAEPTSGPSGDHDACGVAVTADVPIFKKARTEESLVGLKLVIDPSIAEVESTAPAAMTEILIAMVDRVGCVSERDPSALYMTFTHVEALNTTVVTKFVCCLPNVCGNCGFGSLPSHSWCACDECHCIWYCNEECRSSHEYHAASGQCSLLQQCSDNGFSLVGSDLE